MRIAIFSDAGSIEPAFGKFGKGCLEDHLPGFDRALLLPPLRCGFGSPLSRGLSAPQPQFELTLRSRSQGSELDIGFIA